MQHGQSATNSCNAGSTTSNIRMAECLSVLLFVSGVGAGICVQEESSKVNCPPLSCQTGECIYILHRRFDYILIIISVITGPIPALRQWPCKLWLFSFPGRNITVHNPQFSRSIIYNVITVGPTVHSSCSPPCVASIKFWLVNDCPVFAGHMESGVYSLPLYTHWLTLATDVGTMIVLYSILEHTG